MGGFKLKDWVKTTKIRLRKRVGYVLTREQLQEQHGGNPLPRCMGWPDLLLLGIGAVIGAGVFVLTGVAAHDLAGPSVVLSYMMAGFAALLAGLCYTEFVVEQPIAGGAFNYIFLTFGELAAWIVASNMILEYTLSGAAVARGFSAYLATLLGYPASAFILPAGPFHLDFPALLLIAALTLLLMLGTRQSSQFNHAVTASNLVVIGYVLLMALPRVHLPNLRPFFPMGLRGTFSAASVVFFSYVGFDTVATFAEEVHEPGRDLPIGIVGTVTVCSLLYAIMALAITGLVPWTSIDISAPFSDAFLTLLYNSPGWGFREVLLATSARFVSFGAITGIVTSLLTSLMGQARIYVALGRHHLLPPGLAALHSRWNTPASATLLTGLSSGLLALLVDLEVLAELVSIGTLFVFSMLSAGVLWRRYHNPERPTWTAIPLRLAALALFSLGLSVSFTAGAGWQLLLVMALLWLAVVASLLLLPVTFRPASFQVPGSPLTPSLAVLATIHLIGSLGWQAYVRFAAWFVLSLAVYVLYGVHHAEAKWHADLEREGMSLEEGQEDEALYTSVPSHMEPDRNGSLELGLPDKEMDGTDGGIYTLGDEEEEDTRTISPHGHRP
eukprot:jgi/Botrbrau1/10971/Bobra.0383s0025.1